MSSIPTRYRFGDFCIDIAEERFYYKSEYIPLEYRAFQTLLMLAGHAKKTITKEQFLESVWKGAFVEEGNLSVAVAKLRKAFKDKDSTADLIKTVPRKGYRFNVDVIVEYEDGNDSREILEPNRVRLLKIVAGKWRRFAVTTSIIILVVTGIFTCSLLISREKTPILKSATITNMPDSERQFFVRLEGDNFIFETVRVRVIGMDCAVEDPCEVPNNVLKKFAVIKNSSLEHVPLTLPKGEFQILVQNGDSAMSNPLTVKVP
jgi:DNA-binding winged helix-turn-helix (wHTH) protein